MRALTGLSLTTWILKAVISSLSLGQANLPPEPQMATVAAHIDLGASDGGLGRSPIDAGFVSDGGYPLDGGVVPIISARSAIDGTTLPPGWWVSEPKLIQIAGHVVVIENERDELRRQLATQSEPAIYPLIRGATVGVLIGCAGGALATVYLMKKVP